MAHTFRILLPALLLPAAAQAAEAFAPEQVQFFENKVRPVLAQHCYKCHGPEKQNNGLRLDSRAAIVKGSDYGAVVEPGKPDGAKLLKAIRHEAGVEAMPHKADKLPDDAIAALTEWVKMGMPWPEEGKAPEPEKWRAHWAFQPVKPPALPEPATLPPQFTEWHTEPMDRVILAKLTAQGLTPSPQAERAVLIRRAYMALLGFPPTVEQVQEFVNDAAPDAFARVVDGLLASPHFGERWARHWMDTARYADTKGYVFQEERRYAYAYTYRDWLIRAFNADMPYDKFLINQIAADRAGDWKKDPTDLAAMGFLTLGRRFLNNQHDIIDDRLDVVFRGTQALTVGCARCHDHKFDPIPSADYYSLYGVFANSNEPNDKPEIGAAEKSPAREAFDKGVAEREAKAEAYRRERLDEAKNLLQLIKYRAAAQEAGDRPEKELRSFARDRDLNPVVLKAWQEWLKGDGKNAPDNAPPPRLAEFKPADLEPGYNRKHREALKQFINEVERFKATAPGSPARAMVMFDNANFTEPVVFIRGNPGRPGPKVERRFLTALSPEKPKPLTDGSGRLQLAQSIASPENPLTARVFVNRVWTQLCGDPLVENAADFGVRTPAPVQPELLDQLAHHFMQDGWSVKRLLRRVLLSAAWQQSSAHRADMAAKDPENKLFWRQNRQRLDFEALRDSVLKVSGALDVAMFGQPVDLLAEPFTARRSVYGFIDRQNLPGTFRTFDFASPDNTAARRYETTVPQQALYMMNSPFIAAQVRRMIGELHAQPDKDPNFWIAHLYRRILHREPSPDELALNRRAVDELHREPRQTATRWQNGYGSYDEAAKTVAFTPLTYFGKNRWSASEQMPDTKHGWVMLTNQGGHPGETGFAAIRRWNVPEAGNFSISGEVKRPTAAGNGVRALIVHNRLGLLWSADVPAAGTASASAGPIPCQPGDTIDFILDSAGDTNSDSFQWSPVLRNELSGIVTADAEKDFTGPGMSAWEAYAQVLLCTNEFLFVD